MKERAIQYKYKPCSPRDWQKNPRSLSRNQLDVLWYSCGHIYVNYHNLVMFEQSASKVFPQDVFDAGILKAAKEVYLAKHYRWPTFSLNMVNMLDGD